MAMCLGMSPWALPKLQLHKPWKCNRAAAWPWKHAAPVLAPVSPVKKSKQKLDVHKLLATGTEQRHTVAQMALQLPQTTPMQNPRAIHNAAALAYIGDAVYELYVRRHFLTPPQPMDKYNGCVMAVVCCEAQDSLLNKLLKEKLLSEEERDVVRWGKNVVTTHSRATKRAGTAVYSRATALETLIGYLYLTDLDRLQELMAKLGFNGDRS